MARKPAAPAAYAKPEADVPTIRAIKAVAFGRATEGQQKAALEWIVNVAAATHDLAWRPGGPEGERETSFASGRQFVGRQIVRLVNLDLSKIELPKGK